MLIFSCIFKFVKNNISFNKLLIFFFFNRLLFSEILQTDKAYMGELTVIKPEWLVELAPHFYQKTVVDEN